VFVILGLTPGLYSRIPQLWEAEAAKMRDVYRNSLLRIAALGVTDSIIRCFAERKAFYS